MKKHLFWVLIPLLFLSGCQTLDKYTFTKKADIDKKIEDARAASIKESEALRIKETDTLQSLIVQHKAREQAAADSLFKGSVVFSTLKDDAISRPTRIMGQSINLTSMQLPAATPTAQAEAFRTLQTELDEQKVSTETLKKQHEIERGLAKAEVEKQTAALKATEITLANIEKEKTTVLVKAQKVEQELQKEKDKVQDTELAQANRAKEEAEEGERLKRWLMAALGVIALASGAAAVFVPIPAVKMYGTILAIVAGGLVIAIPFIQPFHVLIAILIVVVGVGLLLVKSYDKEAKVSTGIIRAIQEVKTTANNEYEKIVKPKLEQWLTVYDPKTGKAIPDQDAIKHIDNKLREAGDL